MYFGYIAGCTSSGGGGLCSYCMYVFAMPSSVRHMTTMARSGAAAKLLLLHHHRSPPSYSRLAAASSSSCCCIPRSPPCTPLSRQVNPSVSLLLYFTILCLVVVSHLSIHHNNNHNHRFRFHETPLARMIFFHLFDFCHK